MKSEKIIIILIVTIVIFIGGLIAIMFIINKNNNIEDDEIRTLQEGGAEYTQDELKNINFEIIDLDNSIINKIKYDQFIISMKEYIYINGLIQANKAEYISSRQEDNKITIQFRLNDTNKTIITAIVNINDYTYEFSDNY